MTHLVHAEHFEYEPIKEEDELYLAVSLLNISVLENIYRQMLLEAIIQYCFTHHTQETIECDSLLLELNCERLDPETRIQVVEILVENGYYPEAYDRLKMCQWKKIDKEKLLYLLTRRIVDSMYRYDRWIVMIGYCCKNRDFTMKLCCLIWRSFLKEQMNRCTIFGNSKKDRYRIPGFARQSVGADYCNRKFPPYLSSL